MPLPQLHLLASQNNMNFLRDFIERIENIVDGWSESQRRIALATIILVAAAVIGFIIYWIFFRSLFAPSQQVVNVNGQLITVNQELPNITNAGNKNAVNGAAIPTIDSTALGKDTLSQVIYNNKAEDPTLASDGKTLQYYDPISSKFYRIDANGNIVPMSDQVFPGVQNVTWSNKADRAVLELQDGFKVVYDFSQKKQYTLNKDTNNYDFSPNDNQLSFKFTPTNESDRWLGTSNIDGSGAIGIEPLGANGDKVNAQWSPSGQSIGTFTQYINGNQQSVLPLGFKGENFKDFTIDGSGFDYRWTPDGKQMLYSTYSADNNYNDTLHIVDAEGDSIGNNNKSLNLPTSVDKCAFTASGSAAYCAVPVDPPTGGGIAPDKLYTVPHDIYKVDLQTGVTTKIASPADSIDGTNIPAPSHVVVSADDQVLYYTEATTGHIRRILLK